ncbi:hypothetical protein FGB62_236g09 [Gracilaria domingensis]|nr:hypothetical protein FGB62_236g09 [Gracilaria domingensis]
MPNWIEHNSHGRSRALWNIQKSVINTQDPLSIAGQTRVVRIGRQTESQIGSSGGEAGPSTPHETPQPMSSVGLSAAFTVQVNDLRRKSDSALANVQQVSLGLDQLGESIEESPIRQYIQTAEASLLASQRTLDTLQSLSKQI